MCVGVIISRRSERTWNPLLKAKPPPNKNITSHSTNITTFFQSKTMSLWVMPSSILLLLSEPRLHVVSSTTFLFLSRTVVTVVNSTTIISESGTTDPPLDEKHEEAMKDDNDVISEVQKRDKTERHAGGRLGVHSSNKQQPTATVPSVMYNGSAKYNDLLIENFKKWTQAGQLTTTC